MTGTGSFTCDLCAVTKPTFQRYPDKGTDYAPDGTPLFTWANVTTEGWCWECNTGTPRPYRYQDLTHPEPGSPFSGLGAPVPTCPGCGVAVIMFDDDIHTCQPGAASARATVTDGVPVSMCPDCYCSIANGLDSIDVTDERRDEIAAGLVSAGPHAVVDTDDEGSFSMWPCDVCATRLGGHRVGGWIYPVTA